MPAKVVSIKPVEDVKKVVIDGAKGVVEAKDPVKAVDKVTASAGANQDGKQVKVEAVRAQTAPRSYIPINSNQQQGQARGQTFAKGRVADPDKYSASPYSKFSDKVDKATGTKVVPPKNTAQSNPRSPPTPDNRKEAAENKVQSGNKSSGAQTKPFQPAVPLIFQSRSGNANKEKSSGKDRSSQVSNIPVSNMKPLNAAVKRFVPSQLLSKVAGQSALNTQTSRPAGNESKSNPESVLSSLTGNKPIDNKVATQAQGPKNHDNVKSHDETSLGILSGPRDDQNSNSGPDSHDNNDNKRGTRNKRQSRGSREATPTTDDPFAVSWSLRTPNPDQLDKVRKAKDEAVSNTVDTPATTSQAGNYDGTLDTADTETASDSKGKSKVIHNTTQVKSDATPSTKTGSFRLPRQKTVQPGITAATGNTSSSHPSNNGKPPGQHRNIYPPRNYGHNRRQDSQSDTGLKAMQDAWQAQQGGATTMTAIGEQMRVIRGGGPSSSSTTTE